jgi:D-alanyl-D-alanine carboxypeptidase
MMALERGQISLDDKLEQYIPGVPNGKIITLRQMLMMRSGIPDYNSNIAVLLMLSLFPTASWNDNTTLSYIKSMAPLFPPGTSYAYSNSNFVLMGMILEKVTGRKIRDILMDDIIIPLGLTETDWQVNASGAGVSTTTVPAANTIAWNPDFLGCAGGFTSTVGDMIKWATAMRDHVMISDTTYNMWTDISSSYSFRGYPAPFREPHPALFGYGMGLESTGTWFGHNGSWLGYGGQTAYDSVSGACISVLENMQTTTGNGPVALAAYTTIFRRVAEYLYPGSMDDQVYGDGSENVRLNLAPTLTMDATSKSPAQSRFALYPAIGAQAEITAASSDAVFNVAPTIEMGAVSGNAFTLSVAPFLSVGGAEKYSRTVTFAVPPAITPSGAANAGAPPPVLFNNIGPGNTTFSTSTNWDHASVGTDDYVVVDVLLSQASGATATCGGASMTQLASVNVSGSCWAFRFGLKLNSDPGGTKTIVVTPSTNTEITARSAAYSGVVSAATTVTTTGTGTTPSQAATASVSERIVHGFFAYNSGAGGVTFSSPTGGTSRYTLTQARTGIQLSDSDVSATFGITINASRPWAGFTTVLKPL